jgi:hypothetical protein
VRFGALKENAPRAFYRAGGVFAINLSFDCSHELLMTRNKCAFAQMVPGCREFFFELAEARCLASGLLSCQVFWENYAGVGDADLTARQKEHTSISSIFV